MAQPQDAPVFASDPETLVAAAVSLIWDKHRGYAVDHLTRNELNNSVQRNVTIAVAVVARGSAPTIEELFSGRDLGARRAMQSIPLESVIQAFRAVERLLFDDLLENGLRRSVTAMRTSIDLLHETFDMLTEETINSYREASIALDAQTERLEGDLVMSLTSGIEPNPEQFSHQTRLLGVDPERRFIAGVLLGPVSTNPLEMLRFRRQLSSATQSALGDRILFGTIPGGAAVLAPDHGSTRKVGRAIETTLEVSPFRDSVVVGVSSSAVPLPAVEVAYREALACAEVGQRQGLKSQILYHEEHLLDVMLLRQEAIATELAERRIGPLSVGSDLTQTLTVLFRENLSQVRTAAALFLHANTVAYRIRRVKELTGLDPLCLADAVELSMALKAAELSGNGRPD